jgi:mRNA-binding protein PUF3
MERLENGDPDDREKALNELRGNIKSLSFDAHGCLVVQSALKTCSTETQKSLVSELRGHVRTCIGDPHAIYVIECAVEFSTARIVSFIAKELHGAGATAAQHKYGCRVIQRLVEHFPDEQETVTLIDEVIGQAEDLLCHRWGHLILEKLMECGNSEQKHRIIIAILPKLAMVAGDENAARVIEQALKFGSLEDQEKIVDALLNLQVRIAKLIESRGGCWVVKALLQLGEPFVEAVTSCKGFLRNTRAQLEGSKHGIKVLELLED